MKFAIINNISWLNELVPTTWPNSHETNEAEEVINRKTFAEYLVYPSGKSMVRTVVSNGSATFILAFSRNGAPVVDALVNALNTDDITFISEEEWKELLAA